MPERAEIEAAINDAMPEMENRFMWAASTGNHPDATAEGAVRTILEPFLDRVRDARDDDGPEPEPDALGGQNASGG
jgi:hypothetical protein